MLCIEVRVHMAEKVCALRSYKDKQKISMLIKSFEFTFKRTRRHLIDAIVSSGIKFYVLIYLMIMQWFSSEQI